MSESPTPPDIAADEFFRREVNRPDLARARGQAGFGVASVIGTALAGIGLLSKSGSLGSWAVFTGLLAIGLWFLSAALFLWAVAQPTEPTGASGDYSPYEWLNHVLDWSEKQTGIIDARIRRASFVSMLAIVSTFTAIVAVTVESSPAAARDDSAAVIVASEYANSVRGLCPAAITTVGQEGFIIGSIAEGDPDLKFIEVEFSEGDCDSQVVSVPRSEVEAIWLAPSCALVQQGRGSTTSSIDPEAEILMRLTPGPGRAPPSPSPTPKWPFKRQGC